MERHLARRKHDFGYTETYSYSSGDVLILDYYQHQFSMNWSTDLGWNDFTAVWLETGVEKEQALVQHAGTSEVSSLYAYQLGGLVQQAQVEPEHTQVSLIRLGLRTASVTWQLLPTGNDTCVSLVGVASNRIDPESIMKYFQATATPTLREVTGEIPKLLSSVRLERDKLDLLTAAADRSESHRGRS